MGFLLVFAVSAMRRWSARKGRLAFAFVVALAVMVPIAYGALETRFSIAPKSTEYDERAALELAAALLLSDNPMGVGPNSYVVTANTLGYNERAKVAPTVDSRSAHVHNLYFVIADETGYLGLLSFLILLLQPLIVSFVWGWRCRDEICGDLLVGLGVSLTIVYIHSLYEWIFVVHFLQYYFALACGCVAGLVQQFGYGRGKIRLGQPAASRHSNSGHSIQLPNYEPR